MADDERRGSYQSSPPSQWGQSPHIYPHSHHGTPAQEYSGFDFSNTHTPPTPILPMEPGAFGMTAMHQHHRSMAPQLQPLYVPPWPSMLNSQSHGGSTFQPVYAQPVQPVHTMSLSALQTAIPPAPSMRSASMPRKTLTDADRRRMCQYHEDHPNAKQTDIGAIFGVERSTVSKVLRQKEKYLVQDDDSRSPIKRVKGRSPDIERTLANWARNQQKRGLPLDNELIRDKARAFAATISSPEGHQSLSSSWIEKFKLRYNLMGARSRKGSLAPDDSEGLSASTVTSTQQSPNGGSPDSPQGHASGVTSPELHSVRSQESLKNESPDGYIDFIGREVFQAQSSGSLNSAFTDTAPSSFSPGPLSPTSPFFTPDSGTAPSPFIPPPPLTARPILPASLNVTNAHRPRSQTFPLLDHQHSTSSTDVETPRFVPSTSGAMSMDDEDETEASATAVTEAALLSGLDELRTISPAEMMRPPPLPAHVLSSGHHHHNHYEGAREATAMSTSSSLLMSNSSSNSKQTTGTSPEEARQALEVVMNFIEQQPNGFLDFQESMHMGKLMEKLRLESRRASIT